MYKSVQEQLINQEPEWRQSCDLRDDPERKRKIILQKIRQDIPKIAHKDADCVDGDVDGDRLADGTKELMNHTFRIHEVLWPATVRHGWTNNIMLQQTGCH